MIIVGLSFWYAEFRPSERIECAKRNVNNFIFSAFIKFISEYMTTGMNYRIIYKLFSYGIL